MIDDAPAATSLDERLDDAPLRPELVARVGLHACRALAGAPVASREIAPPAIRIALSGEGDVTVTLDARRGGASSRSPTYLSPEQATHASPPDARSDVYSLSLVLYEAISGALPFPRCETVEQLLTVLVTQDLRALDEAAPWLDPALARVVERGLQREPSRRWASPAALGEALAPFTGGSERIAPDTGWALPEEDRIPRALRPGSAAARGMLAWVAVTLVVGAAGVGASLWFVDHQRVASPAFENVAAAPQRPAKREVALALIEKSSVFIHLDPRRPDVVVPQRFRAQPQLVLQVGRDMAVPIPDLDVGVAGVRATLSFDRQPFPCVVPWSAVYALVGEDGRGGVWDEDVPPEVRAADREKKEHAGDAEPP